MVLTKPLNMSLAVSGSPLRKREIASSSKAAANAESLWTLALTVSLKSRVRGIVVIFSYHFCRMGSLGISGISKSPKFAKHLLMAVARSIK